MIPDGDDWRASGIDAWLTGGPTWYYNWEAGGHPPDPDLFDTYPDAEFATYYTSPHFYPNSPLADSDLIFTPDGVYDPTYLHVSSWGDHYDDGAGDYVVWQGTVANPIAGAYGSIEFFHTTALQLDPHYYTFVIPEPATSMLLVLGACTLLRRQRCRARARSSPHA